MEKQEHRGAAQAHHDTEVDKVAASVRGFHERGEKFRIFHGSTNSTRSTAMGKDPRKVVDTSALNRVLYVNTDPEDLYALVEPNVPMDRLVEATLEHGLIPPVVMEFPGITVGGGYSGTSGESSSFRHGFFDRTLEEVEMVLANGEVVKCSQKERADLFHGAAGAVGTMGVTTCVKLRLRKAVKFVETTYWPIAGGMDEAMAKLRSFTAPDRKDYDYVDGIMFSKSHGAIITGRMTDTPSSNLLIQRFSAASDPWFYLHVQSKTSNLPSTATEPITEAIPLPDYLFRYDRGGFWVGKAAFDYTAYFPFNNATRWFLDDFLHTRMLYTALHGSGQSERMIVQDLAVPYSSAKEFVDFTEERTAIWPLWLCPLKQSPGPSMHPHTWRAKDEKGQEGEDMLNIGLWGLALKPATHESFVATNREIEEKLLELGGMKWLYAQTYYTESEFWSQFDRKWYDDLRAKYHAQGLPNVYDKVKAGGEKAKDWKQKWIDSYWSLSATVGLWKAIQSRTYVQAREAKWKQWVPRE